MSNSKESLGYADRLRLKTQNTSKKKLEAFTILAQKIWRGPKQRFDRVLNIGLKSLKGSWVRQRVCMFQLSLRLKYSC